MNSLDLIDQIPHEFGARLEADEFFSDIVVVVAEDGNVEAELARKQAVIVGKSGKRGAAVIVLPMIAEDEHPNIAFGPMTLFPSFQVVENLSLNRDANGTGKSARRIARRIVALIKNAGMTGFLMDLRPDKPAIEPVPMSEEMSKTLKALQVNFRGIEVADENFVQVQLPTFASFPEGETPQFTITCPTDGATIYYTLDDSYPSPANGTIAAGPIDIQGGSVTVRACAYKSGLIASWVNRATISAT